MRDRETIINQLGGIRRLRAMVGAKVFEIPDGIGIHFKGSRKGNVLQVVYDEGKDLYTVEFYKGANLVSRFEEVFCEGLIPLFEQETGLHLRFREAER